MNNRNVIEYINSKLLELNTQQLIPSMSDEDYMENERMIKLLDEILELLTTI
jgi:hypothetical protein